MNSRILKQRCEMKIRLLKHNRSISREYSKKYRKKARIREDSWPKYLKKQKYTGKKIYLLI